MWWRTASETGFDAPLSRHDERELDCFCALSDDSERRCRRDAGSAHLAMHDADGADFPGRVAVVGIEMIEVEMPGADDLREEQSSQ